MSASQKGTYSPHFYNTMKMVWMSHRVVSSQEHTASDLEKMAEDLVKGVLERYSNYMSHKIWCHLYFYRAMMQLATEQEACDSVKSDNVEDRRDNSAEGCVGQSERYFTSFLAEIM